MEAYFVDNSVPGETSVVDDDVDLAIAKLGSLLHQGLEVVLIQDVASDSNSAATGLVDRLCDSSGLGYKLQSAFVLEV